LAKKKIRRNYYKNSLAQRKQRVWGRIFAGVKILLLMGGLAGISLLLILVYDAVTQSPYFEAKKITVEGYSKLSREEVLERTGLKLHDNILSMNMHRLRDTLVAHPWIESAEIERTLPDEIHVRVRERVPIAIVDFEGFYYLDEKGEIFKSVEASDKVVVPIVTGLSLAGFDFEDPWGSEVFESVMEALQLCRRHDTPIPFAALHRVQVDKDTGLTLYASLAPYDAHAVPACTPAVARSAQSGTSTVAIKVGFGRYESKFSRLRDMISYLKQRDGFLNLQYVDLDDTDRVVVRPSVAGHDGVPSVAGGPDTKMGRRKEV
jgi:cell division septal protein FtsQ